MEYLPSMQADAFQSEHETISISWWMPPKQKPPAANCSNSLNVSCPYFICFSYVSLPDKKCNEKSKFVTFKEKKENNDVWQKNNFFGTISAKSTEFGSSVNHRMWIISIYSYKHGIIFHVFNEKYLAAAAPPTGKNISRPMAITRGGFWGGWNFPNLNISILKWNGICWWLKINRK